MINCNDSVKDYYLKDHINSPFSYMVFFRDAGIVKTNSEIKDDSLSITESLCSSGSFKVGLCEASTVNLTTELKDNADGDEITILQFQGDFSPEISYDPIKGVQLSGDDVVLLNQHEIEGTTMVIGDTDPSLIDPSKYYLVLIRFWYIGDEVEFYLDSPYNIQRIIYHLPAKQKGLDHIVNYNSSEIYNLNRKVKYQNPFHQINIYKSLINDNDSEPWYVKRDWEDITAYMELVIPLVGSEFSSFTKAIYTNNVYINGYASLYEIKKPMIPLGLYTIDSSKKQDDLSLRTLVGYDRMKTANLSADINYNLTEGDYIYISDILNQAANGTELIVGMNLSQEKYNVVRINTATSSPIAIYDPVYETLRHETEYVEAKYEEDFVDVQSDASWTERKTVKGSYDSILYDSMYRELDYKTPKNITYGFTVKNDEYITIYNDLEEEGNPVYKFIDIYDDAGDLSDSIWRIDEVKKKSRQIQDIWYPYVTKIHYEETHSSNNTTTQTHLHWDYDVANIKADDLSQYIYGKWKIIDFDRNGFVLTLARDTHYGYKWSNIPEGRGWYILEEYYNKQDEYDKGKITEFELIKGGKTRIYERTHYVSYKWTPPAGRNWVVTNEVYIKQAEYDQGKITEEQLYKGGKRRTYERNLRTAWHETVYMDTLRYKIEGYVHKTGNTVFVKIKNPVTYGAYLLNDDIRNIALTYGTLVQDKQGKAREMILDLSSDDNNIRVNQYGEFTFHYVSKMVWYGENLTDSYTMGENRSVFEPPYLGVSHHSDDEVFNDLEVIVSNADIHTTRRSVISGFLELNGLFLNFDRYGISSYKILEGNYTDYNFEPSEIPLITTQETEIPLVSSESRTLTRDITDTLTLVSSSTQTVPISAPAYLKYHNEYEISDSGSAYMRTLIDSVLIEFIDNTHVRYTHSQSGGDYVTEVKTIDEMLDLALEEFSDIVGYGIEYYVEYDTVLPYEGTIVDNRLESITTYRFGYRLNRTETVNGIRFKVYQLWCYMYVNDPDHYPDPILRGEMYFPMISSSVIPTNQNIQSVAQRSDREKITEFPISTGSRSISLSVYTGTITSTAKEEYNETLNIKTETYRIPNYDSTKTVSLLDNKTSLIQDEQGWRSEFFPNDQESPVLVSIDNEEVANHAVSAYPQTTSVQISENGQFTVSYISRLDIVNVDYPAEMDFYFEADPFFKCTETKTFTGRYVYGIFDDAETEKRRFGPYHPGEIEETFDTRQSNGTSSDASCRYYVEVEKSDASPLSGMYPLLNGQGETIGRVTYSYEDYGLATFAGIVFHVYGDLKKEVIYNDYPETVNTYWIAPPEGITTYKIPVIIDEDIGFGFPLYERGIITDFYTNEEEWNLYNRITISKENYTFDWEGETPDSSWTYEGMELKTENEKDGAYQIWTRDVSIPLITETATVRTDVYRLPHHSKLNQYEPTFDPDKQPVINAENMVYQFASSMGELDINREAEAFATIRAFPTTQELNIDEQGFFEIKYLSKINYYLLEQGNIIQSGSFDAATTPLLGCYARIYNGQIIRKNEAMSLYINDKANKPFDGIKILKSAEKTEAEMGLYPFYYNDLTKEGVSDDMPEVGKWDGNNYYVIEDNFFISNFVFTQAQLIEICQLLLKRIGSLKYYNMNAKIKGISPMEAGDLIIIETADNAYNTAILRHTMNGESLITDTIESNFYD